MTGLYIDRPLNCLTINMSILNLVISTVLRRLQNHACTKGLVVITSYEGLRKHQVCARRRIELLYTHKSYQAINIFTWIIILKSFASFQNRLWIDTPEFCGVDRSVFGWGAKDTQPWCIHYHRFVLILRLIVLVLLSYLKLYINMFPHIQVCKQLPAFHRLILSGTPIQNSLK